jgi:hypothetical protein
MTMSGRGEVLNDRRKLVGVSRGDKGREELYAESVRRYRNWRQQQLRAAWFSYHQDQAARHRRTLEALIARHEEAAAQLMEHEPKGETA